MKKKREMEMKKQFLKSAAILSLAVTAVSTSQPVGAIVNNSKDNINKNKRVLEWLDSYIGYNELTDYSAYVDDKVITLSDKVDFIKYLLNKDEYSDDYYAKDYKEIVNSLKEKLFTYENYLLTLQRKNEKKFGKSASKLTVKELVTGLNVAQYQIIEHNLNLAIEKFTEAIIRLQSEHKELLPFGQILNFKSNALGGGIFSYLNHTHSHFINFYNNYYGKLMSRLPQSLIEKSKLEYIEGVTKFRYLKDQIEQIINNKEINTDELTSEFAVIVNNEKSASRFLSRFSKNDVVNGVFLTEDIPNLKILNDKIQSLEFILKKHKETVNFKGEHLAEINLNEQEISEKIIKNDVLGETDENLNSYVKAVVKEAQHLLFDLYSMEEQKIKISEEVLSESHDLKNAVKEINLLNRQVKAKADPMSYKQIRAKKREDGSFVDMNIIHENEKAKELEKKVKELKIIMSRFNKMIYGYRQQILRRYDKTQTDIELHLRFGEKLLKITSEVIQDPILEGLVSDFREHYEYFKNYRYIPKNSGFHISEIEKNVGEFVNSYDSLEDYYLYNYKDRLSAIKREDYQKFIKRLQGRKLTKESIQKVNKLQSNAFVKFTYSLEKPRISDFTKNFTYNVNIRRDGIEERYYSNKQGSFIPTSKEEIVNLSSNVNMDKSSKLKEESSQKARITNIGKEKIISTTDTEVNGMKKYQQLTSENKDLIKSETVATPQQSSAAQTSVQQPAPVQPVVQESKASQEEINAAHDAISAYKSTVNIANTAGVTTAEMTTLINTQTSNLSDVEKALGNNKVNNGAVNVLREDTARLENMIWNRAYQAIEEFNVARNTYNNQIKTETVPVDNDIEAILAGSQAKISHLDNRIGARHMDQAFVASLLEVTEMSKSISSRIKE